MIGIKSTIVVPLIYTSCYVTIERSDFVRRESCVVDEMYNNHIVTLQCAVVSSH